MAQLVRQAAALMRQHHLSRVQQLLDRKPLVDSLRLNNKGWAFLEDLRRHTPTGLDNLASEISRRAVAEHRKPTKDNSRIDPPMPHEAAAFEKAKRQLLERRRRRA